MGGLLILVPTLNEKNNIEPAIRRISHALPGAGILVIDDDSTDGTWQAAETLKAKVPTLDVMVRRNKIPGLGHSIIDGYRYAKEKEFDEVCIVDCDLQQDPGDVEILRETRPATDIVIGSRYLSRGGLSADYNLFSKLMSSVSNFGVRMLFLFPCRDVTTDFYLLSTRIFEAVPPEDLCCKGYALFSEVKIRAIKAGYTVSEVAVPGYERQQGASKRSWKQVYVFAKEILCLWVELLFTRRITGASVSSARGD